MPDPDAAKANTLLPSHSHLYFAAALPLANCVEITADLSQLTLPPFRMIAKTGVVGIGCSPVGATFKSLACKGRDREIRKRLEILVGRGGISTSLGIAEDNRAAPMALIQTVSIAGLAITVLRR